MTPEQTSDKAAVWAQVAEKCPEFTPAHDATDNYHMVREIVLGGAPAWAGVHQRFKPAPGMRVLDIGANTGIYTAYCALKGAAVTAYEPFPVPFFLLVGIAERTKLSLHAINAAVWTYTGTCAYYGNTSILDGASTAYNGGLQSEGVQWTPEELQAAIPTPCVSLDDAVGNKTFDCMKMDVEGAEYQILLNASIETLRRIRFAFVEFHHWVSEATYEKTIEMLNIVFRFEGTMRDNHGRWDAAYLSQK